MNWREKYDFWTDRSVDGFVYRYKDDYSIQRRAAGESNFHIWREFYDLAECRREWRKICDKAFGNNAPDKTDYFRPKTRGELRDKLKDGVTCEVVEGNASITCHMLAWLDLWVGKDFTVWPSDNKGWALFEPNRARSRQEWIANHANGREPEN